MSDPKVKTEETAGQAKGENTSPSTSTVSERKLGTNRENAKRSTGPRTLEGKARSRFNALKHGLLAKQVMFSPDGALLDEGLHELFESLRDKYGRDDVRTELLIEGVVADHWRNRQGLQCEIRHLAPENAYFGPQSSLPNLQRYTTANRRSMLRSLELLDKVQATESDSGTGQDPDEENFPQGSEGDDGIDKVAEDVPKPRPTD
jgi:hypothetical protein